MQKKILIIDDEPDVLKTIHNILTSEGFDIISVSDGTTAIELLSDTPFDLVITDFRMPEMDGLDIIKAVKDIDKTIEVIILTGFATIENAVQAIKEYQAFDYMSKPLEDIDSLINTVNQAIEKRRLRLENIQKTEDLAQVNQELMNEIHERKRIEKELRESEEKYRCLVELANDSIIILQNGLIEYSNPHMLKISGYSFEEIIGRPFSQLFDPLTPSPQTALTPDNLAAKHSNTLFEAVLIKKDQNMLPVEGNSAHILFKGNPAEILFIRDISDRKEIEEERLKNIRLESIGTLAGGIAHDYNNLLMSIIGYTSLAKSSIESNERAYKFLTEIEIASERAKELTQKLTTFSTGGAILKNNCSISHLVKNTVNFFFNKHNVIFNFFFPENLWQVNIDEAQINEVLQNIIINAIEASAEGGEISIGAENILIDPVNPFRLIPGNYIKIYITDHGVGIPKNQLEKVFDPYFTTKDLGVQKGVGLGLSICHSIIKKHNGHISMQSNRGSGTTVYIYLPVLYKDTNKSVSAIQKSAALKEKIHVMDDEKMIRNLLGLMLRKLGYEVEFASCGEETIEAYKKAFESKNPPAAVILDLTVNQGIGGKETMQKILAIDPHVKGIVASGYSKDPVLNDYKKYGFSGAFTKPYNIDDLGKMLHKVLHEE